ncbi:hypothetical protein INR49_009074 [Caranx melampygus]|nr:hypothetical protein INR49_009074 [Caranx melampygus]
MWAGPVRSCVSVCGGGGGLTVRQVLPSGDGRLLPKRRSLSSLRRHSALDAHTGPRCVGATRGPGAPVGLSVFSASPAVCGGVVLFCVGLICVKRREKLLPGEGRAVLITGLATPWRSTWLRCAGCEWGGAQRLKERGRENLHVLQLDVTDNVQVGGGAQVHQCSGLWGMVNNAGVLHCPADAELLPLAASRRCMEVNFLSAVHLCQVFLPLLRRSRGRIVNMSSMAGVVPMPRFSGYGASKAALGIFGTSDDIRRYRDELLASVPGGQRGLWGSLHLVPPQQSVSDIPAVSKGPVPCAGRPVSCSAVSPAQTSVLPRQDGTAAALLHRLCPTAVFAAIITRLPQRQSGRAPRTEGDTTVLRVQVLIRVWALRFQQDQNRIRT